MKWVNEEAKEPVGQKINNQIADLAELGYHQTFMERTDEENTQVWEAIQEIRMCDK